MLSSFSGGNPISFTSSPLAGAGYSSVPQSTLDDPSSDSGGTLRSIADLIGSVGSVVLGGLAISKLPSGQTPGITTQVQSKAAGIQVVSGPTGYLTSPVGGINLNAILMLLIVGVIIWLIAKKG